MGRCQRSQAREGLRRGRFRGRGARVRERGLLGGHGNRIGCRDPACTIRHEDVSFSSKQAGRMKRAAPQAPSGSPCGAALRRMRLALRGSFYVVLCRCTRVRSTRLPLRPPIHHRFAMAFRAVQGEPDQVRVGTHLRPRLGAAHRAANPAFGVDEAPHGAPPRASTRRAATSCTGASGICAARSTNAANCGSKMACQPARKNRHRRST